MICGKCLREVPDAPYCCQCGAKAGTERTRKKRGNGQGTIYQLPSGHWRCTVTVSSWVDENKKFHRRTKSQTFVKKKDAVAAVSTLLEAPLREKQASFKEVYERWYPTHTAGEDTMGCYRAAMKYFEPLYGVEFRDVDVDDLQECIDDCPRGKRTKENMRALCSLLYKYAVPRHLTYDSLNLGSYLTVSGDGPVPRKSFDDKQLERIRRSVGIVTGAEEIYCLIYLGFRPSEFLALTADSFDKKKLCLVGGAKTAAGKGRTVTISPKVLQYVQARASKPGPLFPDERGEQWPLKVFTEGTFYPALEKMGIDNPMVELPGGGQRHMYTPHSCRHTFATLMKRVDGPEKDKMELIGHASEDMLRYYQDVSLEDLRKITDAI